MEPAHAEPVHHVSIKPPVFMDTAVDGWFAIMDAQFNIAKITNSQTKFYHVLSALPPETISHIPRAVLSNKNFSELQTAVTDMYEKTKPEMFEKLISKTRLTGRPSLFLSELREVADKVGVGDDLVRHKFIQSLPTGIATALASQRELSLSQLGKLADELMPLVQNSAANMVHCQDQDPQSDSQAFLVAQQHPRYHRATQPQSRAATHSPARDARDSRASLGLTPFHPDQKPKVCRAHLFFGSRARTCKPWCHWPDKAADLTMQPSSRAASPSRAASESGNERSRP